MKKTLSIVLCVLLVLLAVACNPTTEHKHEYTSEVTTPATCKSTGTRTYTCKTCGYAYTETVPLAGHTHAEDAKPVSEPTPANCLSTGVAVYECQYCGENYKVVTPKDTTHHAYWDENNKKYVNITEFDEDHCEWSKSAVTEKTYFTPASLVAYCKECKEKTSFTKAEEVSNGKYSYANITGTWVYKNLSDGTAFFVDMKEDSKGSVSSLRVVSFDPEEPLKSATKGSSASVKSLTTNSSSSAKERTLSFTADGVNYTLSESKGKYVLTVGGIEIDLTNENNSFEFIPGHNHQYTPASAESNLAGSIQKDPYFKIMSHLELALMDETYHYVECDVCGISCLPVSHLTSAFKTPDTESACSACGYWKNTDPGEGDVYAVLTIKKSHDLNRFEEIEGYEKELIGYGKILYGYHTTNKTTTKAKKALSDAVEYLKKAKEYLEMIGGDTKGIDNLLDDSDGTTEATSLATAYKKYEKEPGEGSTLLSSADDSVTALKSAMQSLCCSGTDADPSSDCSGGATGGAGKALSDWIGAKSEEVDEFCVPEGTTLELDLGSYRTSRKVEYTFAEKTGWTGMTDATVSLTEKGFLVKSTAEIVFAAKL